MRSFKSSKGFTLFELLMLIFIILIAVIVWSGILKGNLWYTESGVLRKLKLDHPNVTQIIDTERSVWQYSEITVIEDSQTVKYNLDSNVLFNYELHRKVD